MHKKMNENVKNYAYILVLLIVSNICFYTEDKIYIYLVLTMLAFILLGKEILYKRNNKIIIDNCIIWLIVIYSIFTFNGICRLKCGVYNWDMMIYTCLQNCIICISLREIIKSEQWFEILKHIIIVSAFLSLFFLILLEAKNLGIPGVRIGDSLSGNVNVVGANFGILSTFLAYICTKEKKILNWLVFVLIAVVMLLTGSKMTLIILALDLFYLFMNSKNKFIALIVVCICGAILLWLVFSVPYFYNIIGYRVVDMIYQLFGIGPGHYSNSTNVRKIMILEGFTFFMNHPIFGGGEKYFGSLTSTIYQYSHCNYTELLCNFGIVGFSIYYVPLFINLMILIKNRKESSGLYFLGITLLIGRLILDWMQVTHSEPCVGYLPMIFSFVCVSNKKQIVSAADSKGDM